MSRDIDSVLLEYDTAADQPGGTKLADWIARYPEYQDDLIDYAYYNFVFQKGESYRRTDAKAAGYLTLAGVVRERMMAEGLYAAGRSADPLKGILIAARAQSIEPPELARRIGIGLPVVIKLDRRLIRPSTIPVELVSRIAKELQAFVSDVSAYLRRPLTLSPQANYRASSAPQVSAAQDFLDALNACADVSAEQKEFWKNESGVVLGDTE